MSPKPQCLAVDGRKVNDTCKFSCQNGYKLPDPQKDTLKCLETGSWDAPIINCERKCLIDGVLDHIKKGYARGHFTN